jgi:hypothetical protein
MALTVEIALAEVKTQSARRLSFFQTHAVQRVLLCIVLTSFAP